MKLNKNQKTAKALLTLNILIDEEQKKLYDKYKNMELSHNRKIGLLKKIDFFLKMQQTTKTFVENEFWNNQISDVRHSIQKELNNYGRIYWG